MPQGTRARKQIVIRLLMDGPRGPQVVAEWRGDEPCPGPAELEAAMKRGYRRGLRMPRAEVTKEEAREPSDSAG